MTAERLVYPALVMVILTALTFGVVRLVVPRGSSEAAVRTSVPSSSGESDGQSAKKQSSTTSLEPVRSLGMVQRNALAGTTARETSDTASSDTVVKTTLPPTPLPYRLIGTVTGQSLYRSAVLQHTKNDSIRAIAPGQTWGDLRMLQVGDEHVRIRNLKANRSEVLRLQRADTGGTVVVEAPPRSSPNRGKKTSSSGPDEPSNRPGGFGGRGGLGPNTGETSREPDDNQRSEQYDNQQRNKKRLEKLRKILQKRRKKRN